MKLAHAKSAVVEVAAAVVDTAVAAADTVEEAVVATAAAKLLASC